MTDEREYGELKPDSLNLIKCDRIVGPIVEFGRSWRFMSRNRLGVLDVASIFQVRRYPGRSKSMATNSARKSAVLGPPLDHPKYVVTSHLATGQCPCPATRRPKKWRSALGISALDVCVQILLGLVVRGHFMKLSTLSLGASNKATNRRFKQGHFC